MGIYIKGMEMPTSCGDCKAFVCYRQWAGDVGDCFCGITKNDAKAKEKNADCPLVPVPQHGRLIDADALENDKDKYIGGEESRSRFHHWVQVQRTVIPESEEAHT